MAVLGIRGFPGVQGGPEVHSENRYPYLIEKGCEVTVFTRKPHVNPAINSYKGVRLITLPCLHNKYLEAFLHTFYGIFAARKISPDILQIHAIGPSLFVPLAKLFGMKVVITHHGKDYERKKWNWFARSILRLGEYVGCRWADAVICPSKITADYLAAKYNREISVIAHGISIPDLQHTESILKNYDLQKNKYILTVGRFVPEKGFHDLIEAFRQISAPEGAFQADNWKLVIVGAPTCEDQYAKKLKKMAGQNQNIVLTGLLTGKSLQELYNNAAVFILPSYYECLPNVLLEALGHGISCIVSDIPAHRNLNLSEDRFFKAGDIAAIKNKIIEFMKRPLNLEEKNAQMRMVAEKYDPKAGADLQLEVYKKVLLLREGC